MLPSPYMMSLPSGSDFILLFCLVTLKSVVQVKSFVWILVEPIVSSTPLFLILPRFCQLVLKPVIYEVGTLKSKSVVVLS